MEGRNRRKKGRKEYKEGIRGRTDGRTDERTGGRKEYKKGKK